MVSESDNSVRGQEAVGSQVTAGTAGSALPGAFTAAQIAAPLGISPQAVRKALLDTPAAGIRIVGGNEASVWAVARLPEGIKNRLADQARQRKYRSIEAMLSAPPTIWEPPVPLAKLRDEDQTYAVKLRDSLRPWLLQQHDPNLTTAEMEAKGVEDYARHFGGKISGRYWRELFMRTLQRDGGAENWGRLEIYLPANPRPKEEPVRVVSEAIAEEFGEIDSYIQAFRNPAKPTEVERRGVWTLALGKYASLVRIGTPEKQAARRVRSFLFAKAAFLAPTRDALRRAFERKLESLENSGGDPKALRDGRENNGEHYQLPENDRDLLVHRAVFYYRGDVAPAWRDLIASGFSDAVRQRYGGKSRRKSHVPASVMDSVSAEVAILTVMYQGKRAFDSIKGYVDRNYEGIHSRVCMSADDFTMPVYFYVPDGQGWFNVTRGQILVFIDFRSLRILGWSMQPDRNYSSLTIRSLCTHVFAEHGVPLVIQFERGIWESSTLVKGRDPAPMSFAETVQGLREFGIHFIHSIRPRSKTVERIGGLLQDLMEHEPGYCGRDERRDAPETLRKQIAEVESRKVHPRTYFHSYEQWEKRFGEIVDQYNETKQQGKILPDLSPDEAFAKFADQDDPPMEFGGQFRYLLALHKEQKTVTLNGVEFRIGKKRFQYCGDQLAHLVGREVLAWFDSENPEMIVVTDLNRKNPICVPRVPSPSALECLIDPESKTLAQALQSVEGQASYMKARYHAIKSKFPMPKRVTVADPAAVRLGQQIEQQKAAQKQKAATADRMRSQARRLGVPAAMVDDDPDTQRALELLDQAERSRRHGTEQAAQSPQEEI